MYKLNWDKILTFEDKQVVVIVFVFVVVVVVFAWEATATHDLHSSLAYLNMVENYSLLYCSLGHSETGLAASVHC